MEHRREPVHIEPKGWGREIWIANSDLYCGKVLEMRKGKRCSLHFHKLKTESFYLHSGKVHIRVRSSPESEIVEEFEMDPGDCIDIPPGLVTRWKHSKMLNCSSSRLSISRPIRIG